MMRTSLHHIRHAGDTVLNLLYPSLCYHCHTPSADALCSHCSPLFALETDAICSRCGIFLQGSFQDDTGCPDCRDHTPLYTESPYIHHGAVAEAIGLYKYHAQLHWARLFAQKIYERSSSYIALFDIIIPVPLHRSRLRNRGFNQTEEIARHLCSLTGATTIPLISRTRATLSQARAKNRTQRLENLTEAFSPRESAAGAAVLVLDDVCTTGSTLRACARAIKDARHIGGITVTRRIKTRPIQTL